VLGRDYSTGGMSPISPCGRRKLNQSMYSATAIVAAFLAGPRPPVLGLRGQGLIQTCAGPERHARVYESAPCPAVPGLLVFEHVYD
jgi:hypothetical protein